MSPSTPKAETTEEAPLAPEPTGSSDAQWSTYAEKPADKEAEEEYPPPGPQVEQTLGEPKES